MQRPFTGPMPSRASPPYDFFAVGGAGAIGSGMSEFQMSCIISQRPPSFTQRTMYLPESAGGNPGGRLAFAGHTKFQRPSSVAEAPLAHTDSARIERVAAIVFICPKNPRIASFPRTGAM